MHGATSAAASAIASDHALCVDMLQALHKYKMFIHTNFVRRQSSGYTAQLTKEGAMDIISCSPWILAETDPVEVGLRLMELFDAAVHICDLCKEVRHPHALPCLLPDVSLVF